MKFEIIKKYILLIADENFGKWIIDRENDGTPEHPMHTALKNKTFRNKILYNKLCKLLIDRKMSVPELRKKTKISPDTITKMRKDQDLKD